MRFLALVLTFVISVPVMSLGAIPKAKHGAPVLVVIAPWKNAEAIVAEAGGRVIGFDRAVFAVVGQSDSPEFAERLLLLGAWLVRDGSRLSWLC